jgi:hypothetical protein
MNINIENYFKLYPELKASINKNPDFVTAHNFVDKATASGTSFEVYYASEKIKATIDLYFKKLAEQSSVVNKEEKSAKAAKPPKAKASTKASTPKVAKTKPERKVKTEPNSAVFVEHIPSDIALVKKYIAIDGKTKTYEQILSLWRAFEKATVERKVTKESPYRIAINTMKASLQSALVKSESVGELKLSIEPKSLKEYKVIADSVEKSPSVSMLIELINISGKAKMEERAMRLSKRMSKALSSGSLDKDRYKSEIESALVYIEAYLEKETNRIEMKDHALSGLGEISVMGCACSKGLSGNSRTQNAVILKLIQEKVKNLSPTELNRAFKDTVAPSICKLIARKLIQAGQLSMAVIRNPAKPQVSLSGVGSYNRNDFDFGSEVLDLRVRHAAQKQAKSFSGHSGFSGLGQVDVMPSTKDDAVILSAQQIMDMKFKTIGLTGKYRALIGDPEPAFSAMIYGKPKQGKSTVAIDMAKELTKLGKVLYCAFEEGHGGTLQDKIKRNNANVPGLDFANKLPPNLTRYQFVFIDSVSDAGLDEVFFKALIKTNKPNTSIIGIFHATKDGKFRGGQTFAHDVDVLMRVENGVVYAQGRYAPQGEMRI